MRGNMLSPGTLLALWPIACIKRCSRVTELRLRTDAVNTSGAIFRFVERGEGRLPFQFRAHQRLPGDEYAPCRVLLLEEA